MGEQVIIRLQPQELGSKLAAKWKGPFTVTKVPNRFQIEYREGNITKCSHISYVKKFFGKQWFLGTKGQRPGRVSCCLTATMPGRLRVASGETCQERKRRRFTISSLGEIEKKRHLLSCKVVVRPIGPKEDLPEDLQQVLDAANPDGFIEGQALLDLCGQRSSERGSDCDDPMVSLLQHDLLLSEDSEEEPSEQLSAKVSSSKDVRCNILTGGIAYETAAHYGSVTKNPSLPVFQTKDPVPVPVASSDRLKDVVETISKKERPLGELKGNIIFSHLNFDESSASDEVAACERSASVSNCYIGATLRKGRESRVLSIVDKLPSGDCCNPMIDTFKTDRLNIGIMKPQNKVIFNVGSANCNRVAKTAIANPAMFTKKRREDSLSLLTVRCKQTPFFYDNGLVNYNNHISKHFHENNNKEIALNRIYEKETNHVVDEPDVRGRHEINTSHFGYIAKLGYRKLKNSLNNNYSFIKTTLGWIMLTFYLMFMGGITGQVKAYLNYDNINKPTVIAVTGGNDDNSIQVISRREDGFYKYGVYILFWLIAWILFRMMTSEVRRGINRGRDDLRKQNTCYSHRACKSMPMICLLILRVLLRRFHYLFFSFLFFFFFFFLFLGFIYMAGAYTDHIYITS